MRDRAGHREKDLAVVAGNKATPGGDRWLGLWNFSVSQISCYVWDDITTDLLLGSLHGMAE